MSYSQEIKRELCACRSHCKRCSKALLYGMLLFGRGVTQELPDAEDAAAVLLSTENKEAADLFAQTAIDLTGAIITVTEPDLAGRLDGGKRAVYNVTIDDESDLHTLFRIFFPKGILDRSGIEPSFVRQECCAMSFLRGAYLACGTMANPEKEYHLEFGAGGEALCDDLIELLDLYELDFHKSTRGKNAIAYTKESNQIEDFLARTGAVKASMSLMNLKIEKELRNKVNRVTNCETANIDKTVNASMEQIRRIERIQEKLGFAQLPPPLREAATLRLENPDASLRELSELTGGKISRSGFNHRLQKLAEIADKLED